MKHPVLCAAFACANAASAEAEWVAANIVKVNAPRSRITLDHASIASINMAAMTMPFKVAEASMLAPLKPGDKVRFTVQLRDDELVVTRIEPLR